MNARNDPEIRALEDDLRQRINRERRHDTRTQRRVLCTMTLATCADALGLAYVATADIQHWAVWIFSLAVVGLVLFAHGLMAVITWRRLRALARGEWL